jgi:uncharacterized PurR-regulated membrane protein YhhQ (DUF165 family)
VKRLATAAAYLASIVAANYAISHIGTQYAPGAPHVLPVGFGLDAPSGVYVVGLTLVLRDVVQRQWGKLPTFVLIILGAALTALFSPALAFASAVAFLLSESADFGTFTLTERFGYPAAAVASNVVGLVVDTIAFLTIAFGSLQFWQGQMVGKAYATVAFLAWVAVVAIRNRRAVTA